MGVIEGRREGGGVGLESTAPVRWRAPAVESTAPGAHGETGCFAPSCPTLGLGCLCPTLVYHAGL